MRRRCCRPYAQPYDHGNFKDNECATKDYWQAVRKFCDEHGMVLIFDDVRTGFRLDLAGSIIITELKQYLICFCKSSCKTAIICLLFAAAII